MDGGVALKVDTVAYPLHASYMLFYPLNWALNSAARWVLRALGVKEGSHQEILTYDEIEGLVEGSALDADGLGFARRLVPQPRLKSRCRVYDLKIPRGIRMPRTACPSPAN